MDIHPDECDGEAYAEMELSAGSLPRRFGGRTSACLTCFAKELATRNSRTLDPSLTLTRTQYRAIVCNAGNAKPLTHAGFANPCNAQQPLTDHS